MIIGIKMDSVDDNQSIEEKVNKILSYYKQDKENLVQILYEIQDEFGYIPDTILENVAKYLSIPVTQINAVIKFNSSLSIKPLGKYQIKVCTGNSCFAEGSERILNRIKSKLNIKVGETTSDGLFSLDTKRCLGFCSQGPNFSINGEVYKKANAQMVDEVLDELIRQNK